MKDDNLPASEPGPVYEYDYRATHERLTLLESALREMVRTFREGQSPVLRDLADTLERYLPKEGKRV